MNATLEVENQRSVSNHEGSAPSRTTKAQDAHAVATLYTALETAPRGPSGEPKAEEPVVETRHSVLDFSTEAWDGLIPRDEPQLRHAFLQAVEGSGMGDSPTYVAVRWQGRVVGVLVAYLTDIDLLTLASPKLTRFANSIRKGRLRRLLIIRSVSCGPVITNCRSNLYVAPDLPQDVQRQVCTLLVRQLGRIPGGSLTVLFEFRDATADTFGPALSAAGYLHAASLPGTQLDIAWPSFDEYVGAMRKFYRRAVRHDLESGNGLEIRVEADFGHLAAEAHALYENVLERADVVMERLTPSFFAALGGFDQARLVTAREKATGRLVGIELLMVGDTMVQDLYTGVDYSVNERYNVYFNLVYPGIDLACRAGLQSVSMGQTSYTFKSRLGVRPYRLTLFAKHRNPGVQAVLERCKGLLCPKVETVTHRVFRVDARSEELKSAATHEP